MLQTSTQVTYVSSRFPAMDSRLVRLASVVPIDCSSQVDDVDHLPDDGLDEAILPRTYETYMT